MDVIADRPVARGLAEACGVPHQSPQSLLFESGEVVWHASHWDITASSLEKAWGTAEPG